MITLYWIGEYIRVFIAYFFIMFLWPAVVFRRFLKGKSRSFCFAFCPTVQVVLVNTLVLGLGLLHILRPWVFRVLFYGIFLAALLRRYHFGKEHLHLLKRLITGTYGYKLFALHVRQQIFAFFGRVRNRFLQFMKGHWIEYISLSAVLFFGIVYFTYGVFQDYSYGFGDMYTHSAWIYRLTQGQIFSSGVYPEAMHCFVYAVRELFGVSIYSTMLFLAGIHNIVFFVCVYLFLREIFRWRFTPILAMMAFFTLDVVCINEIFSMSRLQWTLPQEFGFFTMFVCVTFLMKYLRSDHRVPLEWVNPFIFFKNKIGRVRIRELPEPVRELREKEYAVKYTKGYWDRNLFLFMMALCASLTVHFYPTIMAFFLCLAVVPTAIGKIFHPRRLIPLCVTAVYGILIAVVPMAGALASGIPFQGSIGWAVNIINGTDGESNSNIVLDQETGEEITGDITFQFGNDKTQNEEPAEENGTDTGEHPAVDSQPAEKVPLLQRLRSFIDEKGRALYYDGYVTLYREDRARWIVGSTIAGLVIWLIGKVFCRGKRLDSYLTIILCSVFFMMLYCASSLGLPSLIAGARLCSMEQLLILAMMFVPLDAVMQLLTMIGAEGIWSVLGLLLTAGIYIGSMELGIFHGYLYFELTRFNSAVMTTQSIIRTLPRETYTICSTTDEIYQIVEYGWHEELTNFVNQSRSGDYTIPTRYLFLYVEKTPIEYAQSHFFAGPRWLAWQRYPEYYNSFVSQCPEITTSEITPQLAAEAPLAFPNRSSVYGNLVSRTYVEARIQEWVEEFSRLYPHEVHVYYEDENFVCYYFEQNPYKLYQLSIY